MQKKESWFSRLLNFLDLDDSKNPQDRRKLERKKLVYYLRITNADTREALGQIFDITPEGLSVDLLTPLPLETVYTLQLDLLDPTFEKLFITFKARSKWIQPDRVVLGYYNMGFQIIEIDSEDIPIIEKIIALYAASS